MRGAIHRIHHTSSWRGDYLRTGITLSLIIIIVNNIITLVFVVTKSKGRLGFQNSIEPNKELGVYETGFRSPYA